MKIIAKMLFGGLGIFIAAVFAAVGIQEYAVEQQRKILRKRKLHKTSFTSQHVVKT